MLNYFIYLMCKKDKIQVKCNRWFGEARDFEVKKSECSALLIKI